MDHEQEAARVHRRILRRMTPAQKYAQLLTLRKTAWRLKAANLRQRHPDWSDAEVQARVARIFLHANT
jgi:hypothetical protein